ncbi:MAG: TRAP transporter permease [Rhodospirillales bacterium]|nr:TRAP transporter permease [Rhodospirillales bacterium]
MAETPGRGVPEDEPGRRPLPGAAGTEASGSDADEDAASLNRKLEDIEYTGHKHGPRLAFAISLVAFVWSLFQMWIASPFPFMLNIGIITDVPARAIHLAFALLLCYLTFPAARRFASNRVPWYDLILAAVACATTLYLYVNWDGLVSRQGILLTVEMLGVKVPIEAIIGGVGIVLLLEATRRAIGLPLVIVAIVFLIYSVFGQSMPTIISHKGLSLNRLIGYQWFSGEAIFGIPIDVSVSFVFLFVMFGALLDKAGAGKYFLDLSFAMVGRYRGGPAKAAILASGMTGMISGSSIANVVTTGTFTIPVMVRTGLPAVKAGAIEVAASTNGQMMPPIMGAAAFIMAELLGISYFEVVKAAFIPAILAYLALLYISHLEALKLGLRGLTRAEIPRLFSTLLSGIHYLIPMAVLVYLLMIEQWTAGSAVFYSIVVLLALMIIEPVFVAMRDRSASIGAALGVGLANIYAGMVAGARNMVGIAVAVAVAGIIVGAVASTGLNNALVGVVEALSGGNVYILLVLTAVLCLILGMGLPTTANYLVVASLMAGVLVELGSAAGIVLPLIAVHLFVFYYGLLADSTPPVCLAAFAASAISRADPLRTGVQAFLYDIRTGLLPFIFIFNPELLLIGVTSWLHGIAIFFVSLIAIFCFSSATQGWLLVKVRFYEAIMLLIVALALFRPGAIMDRIFPPFAPVELDRFVSGELAVEPGREVRLHVTRETRYGDRYKLFLLKAPESSAATPNEPYGLTLEREPDGRYYVSDMAINSPAEKVGVDFGDYVTAFDVRQLDLPAKEWVWPFAFALLGFVIFLQWLRWRREPHPQAVAQPAR